MPVHTNIDMVLFLAYRVKRRGRNFLYDPMAVRDIFKSKAAVLARGYGKQGVFLGKFLCVRLKQSNECAGQLHIVAALRVLTNLYTVHTPAKQVIGNGFPLIHKDLHQRRILARVLKHNRIFRIRKNVSAVCGAFLHIVAAKRQIGSKGSVIAARLIRVNGNHFQKAACRDHAAIKGRQVSGSIQTKRNIFVFLIHAKAEQFICF